MVGNRLQNRTKFILSFDDYHPLNLKIAKMLKARNLIATFYIETNNPATLKQIKLIHAIGHEIGGHTLSHPSDLKALPIAEAAAEIQVCKKQIEDITGEECTSFAYPRGRYNQDIKYLVKKAGFIDARTTIVFSYDTPVDYYQTDTTLHMYNGRPEYKGKNWYDFVDEYLQAALDRYGEFHVWGHAFELDRDDQWEQFEKMLDKVQKYIVKGYELI